MLYTDRQVTGRQLKAAKCAKMFRFLFWIVALGLQGAHFQEIPTFRCDYTFDATLGGWYKFFDRRVPWSMARVTCKNEGSRLYSPLSITSMNTAVALMKNLSVTAIHTSTAILHPEKETKIKYLTLAQDGRVLGTGVLTSRRFMCFKRYSEDLEVDECGSLDDDYRLNKKTGKCYKFHPHRLTWFEAKRTCINEGGHLLTINSQEEVDYVKEIYARRSYIDVERLPGYQFLDNAFVGIRSLDYGKTWTSLNDEDTTTSEYAKFAENEPSNLLGDEFCASVGKNGTLYDEPCQRKMFAICEKIPTKILCNNTDVMLLDNEKSQKGHYDIILPSRYFDDDDEY